MHAEIHPRKGRQRGDDDADDAQRRVFVPARKAAERRHDVLRVAGREGIAASPGARRLDDREIRVLDPRPRNAERQLQKLVEDRADEADEEQIIALALVHAPKDRQREHNKQDLVSEIRDCGEKPIQRRAADALQPIEKRHKRPPYVLIAPPHAELFSILSNAPAVVKETHTRRAAKFGLRVDKTCVARDEFQTFQK